MMTLVDMVILTVFAILYAVIDVNCHVPYMKDMTMNDQFPPVYTRAAQGIPIGHLRPLGFQKRPSGKISVTATMPTPHAFNIKYIRPNKAGVFQESVKHLPVLGQWDSDTYLEKQFGKLNLTVTVKENYETAGTTTPMTMKRFLMDYQHEEWYLQSVMPEEMLKDVHMPNPLKCGSYSKRLQEVELWMSAGKTSSSLHNHEDHVLHCNLFGRNDFIVMENKYKNVFNYKEKYKNAGSGASTLNMDLINVFAYNKIPAVPWTYASLRQGDCIFIPAGYLHQVRSYGRSISYTILFAPSLIFDSSDCRKIDDDKEEKRLNEVNLVWVQRAGNRLLSDEIITPDTLKHALDLLIRDGEVLHYERFQHFYEDVLKLAPRNIPNAERAWNLLTSTQGQQHMTRSSLRGLSKTTLSRVAKIFEDVRLGMYFEKEEL